MVDAVVRDGLFQAVVSLPDAQLLQWMLACADSDEQVT